MGSDPFAAGDVFWAPDPYNAGTNPRLWLVLATDELPYAGEEYICAALTLSDLPNNVEVRHDDWVVGSHPDKTSYCSPWVMATVKHDSVVDEQGYVTEGVSEKIIRQSIAYLSGDL